MTLGPRGGMRGGCPQRDATDPVLGMEGNAAAGMAGMGGRGGHARLRPPGRIWQKRGRPFPAPVTATTRGSVCAEREVHQREESEEGKPLIKESLSRNLILNWTINYGEKKERKLIP